MAKSRRPANPPAPEALRVEDLVLGYGAHIALEGLSGTFATDEATALVGPNGAGKSTLLKALAGVIRPLKGRVAWPSRRRVAYLPQRSQLDLSFPVDVGGMVAFGLAGARAPVQLDAAMRRAAVASALTDVGLGGLAHRPIGALSGGQLQRALFARLLLQDADILLLDEPFAGVDEATTQLLLGFLPNWRREHRTVIAAVHDLDQVHQRFAHTLWLDRRPLAWGPTGTVLSTASGTVASIGGEGRQQPDRLRTIA